MKRFRPRTDNKFGAIRHDADGYKFASKKERDRYLQLRILERAGEIQNLEVHPEFPLVIDGEPVLSWSADGRYRRPLKAIMDFAYFQDGRRVVEDTKGMDTPLSRLKRAIVEHTYRVRVTVL